MRHASRKEVSQPVAITARINWSCVNKMTTLIFISSLLLWGYVELTDAERFPIEHVRIDGEASHTAHEIIQTAITPHVQSGFFNVSLSTLKSELELLPWIATATVKRKWPDTLIINLTEHVPYCIWNQTGIIAADNTLFIPDQTLSDPSLPQLFGPEGSHQIVLSMYEQLQHQLIPLQIKIASLTLDNYYTWQMTLTNGLQLKLGREDITVRVSRFVKAYPKVLANRIDDVVYVDLRYRHGMAVKWRNIG